MMGYSSGFCLKKVSKLLAFGLGGIFIVVQAMSYNGYINVNYGGIQKDIEVQPPLHAFSIAKFRTIIAKSVIGFILELTGS